MKKISAKQLFETFNSYIIVDLRDLRCFYLYRIPYSYPFSQCYECIEQINKTVCFVCCDGKESQLKTEQFLNAVYLEGGLVQWLKHDYDDIILKHYSNLEICEGECCIVK